MKRISLSIAFVAALLILNISNSQAISISFNQTNPFDSVGDLVNVDLVISGLGDYEAPSVGAFDLNVTFNPSILIFSSYLLGPFLGDLGLGEASDFSLGEISSGLINVSEVSFLEADTLSCFFCIPPYLDDIQPDSFSIATLTFEIYSVETSILSITDLSLVKDAFAEELSFDVTAGSVAPVPEPATILLLVSGMAGLGVFGRKKFKK